MEEFWRPWLSSDSFKIEEWKPREVTMPASQCLKSLVDLATCSVNISDILIV